MHLKDFVGGLEIVDIVPQRDETGVVVAIQVTLNATLAEPDKDMQQQIRADNVAACLKQMELEEATAPLRAQIYELNEDLEERKRQLASVQNIWEEEVETTKKFWQEEVTQLQKEAGVSEGRAKAWERIAGERMHELNQLHQEIDTAIQLLGRLQVRE